MIEGRNAVMRCERFLAVAGGVGGEAPGAHELGQSEPGGGLVLDDEHPLAGGVRRGHNRILACRFYTVQQIQTAQPFRSAASCQGPPISLIPWWIHGPVGGRRSRYRRAQRPTGGHRRDGGLLRVSDPDRPGHPVPRRRPAGRDERRPDFAAVRGRGLAGRHGAAGRAHALVPASKRPDRKRALAGHAAAAAGNRPRRAADAADPRRRRPAAPGDPAVGAAAAHRADEPAGGPGAPGPDGRGHPRRGGGGRRRRPRGVAARVPGRPLRAPRRPGVGRRGGAERAVRAGPPASGLGRGDRHRASWARAGP